MSSEATINDSDLKTSKKTTRYLHLLWILEYCRSRSVITDNVKCVINISCCLSVLGNEPGTSVIMYLCTILRPVPYHVNQLESH